MPGSGYGRVIGTSESTSGRSTPRVYGEEASLYERRTAGHAPWRRRLVELLPLREGDVVLDVGCGTGLCFPFLREKVGTSGAIIGIDESPEMLRVASQHVRDNDWHNVTLIEAPAERAQIPVSADAALFCAVHDILQVPEALHNVLSHVRPGGWVAAGGGKWTAPWLIPINLLAYVVHEPYVRDFHGFARPWRPLEDFVDDLQVSEVAFGTGYLAVGRAKATIPGRRREMGAGQSSSPVRQAR